jgi:hypothetical protein
MNVESIQNYKYRVVKTRTNAATILATTCSQLLKQKYSISKYKRECLYSQVD